ncbi:hypothetical protein NCER_100814 [Vairimorpha ceranae BRL01]|uniref:Uncharacterized protein n=1 Tax=Vairimorpha ceranae (strain BRL01) TaxID=578460 RepID=C4V8I5_VAIC1|nr:hypothetical protein NCER_100814 [Vairimorpha ceranae BRL01]
MFYLRKRFNNFTPMYDLTVLEDIQQELDKQHTLQAQKEFELAIEGFNRIKNLLNQRDDLLLSKQEDGLFTEFWTKAFENFGVNEEILPYIDSKLDLSWLKSFKVEYRKEYICCIKIELFPNEYVENEYLEKKMGANEIESTKVIWKNNDKCIFFQFFDTDDDDWEVFDFMYEVYRDAYYWYSLESE